jgi:hypothetical protein
VDRVVPPAEAGRWIRQIMKMQWKQQDKAVFSVVQMAAKTGDRTRDLDPDLVETIVGWLKSRQAKDSIIKPVQEKTARAMADQDIRFGEKLPQGLVLK